MSLTIQVIEFRDRAEKLHDAIVRSQAELTITAEARAKLVLGLCELALEHYGAILTLLQTNQHVGSALALGRPLIESCIRAYWVARCASDKEIQTARNNDNFFPTLFDAAEKVRLSFEPESSKAGEKLFLSKTLRRQLNDFTHSGLIQIAMRFDEDRSVAPTYPESTLITLLRLTSEYTLYAQILNFAMWNVPHLNDPLIAIYNNSFAENP